MSGVIVYAYSAYGEVAVLGPDGDSSLQYTGRENDGAGLYYYRARYYDSALKRFVSEDPFGTIGGINVYGYVEGNPVSATDALGLKPVPGKWEWLNPVKKLACELIKGGNKLNNLATEAQIKEELTTWSRNIDRINEFARVEIERCIRRYPNDKCLRDECIRAASKESSLARQAEDARHIAKMRELLTPSTGQQVGGFADAVCDAL